MTIQTKTQIIQNFQQGDVPQGSDFQNWILSCITAAETSAQSMTGDLNVAGTLTAGAFAISNLTVNSITASVVNATVVSASTGTFNDLFYVNNLGTASDLRIKTAIEPLGDVLAKLRRLNPVSYQKLSNLGHTEFGVVAQELQEVFPELVNNTEPLTVNYLGFIGLLLRAVQQLDENQQTCAT